MSQVHQHFDSWTDACRSAGVRPGKASPKNLTPNYSKGKMHALSEVKRVARELRTTTLSKTQYDSHSPEVKACTVARLWGGWLKAIEAAGLEAHDKYHTEIPLSELALEFVDAIREMGKVPNVHQMARRSQHSKNTFTRKYDNSYISFKIAAIDFLLKRGDLSTDIKEVLKNHLASLRPCSPPEPAVAAPHRKGRHLGFRAFAFAPTCESDVVSLFGAVADDLGFEIVSQRAAFPDCEARRRARSRRAHYAKCLIEFEFESRDFKRHGHPVEGCDLIVCWRDDWPDCPIEVLELRSEINKLEGWK